MKEAQQNVPSEWYSCIAVYLYFSKSPSINIETISCPLYHYEDVDTIKDARYSMVNIPSNKSRVNSAITSNHSSYVEMNSVTVHSGKDVVMQSNPSYNVVDVKNS